MPGVVVEARSPSIIEGVRTVTSDGAGRYLIVTLEPGTYSITFTLAGFSTLIREGIQLTTGFAATVDAQLAVGALDESVTVSGASPVVDVQTNLQRSIIDRAVIDEVPTGKSFQSYALLTPGMNVSSQFGTALNQDAGGTTAQTVGAPSTSTAAARKTGKQTSTAWTSATERGLLRALPVELTMVNDLPIMNDASRSRVPYGRDPELLLYYLDHNAYPPEAPGIWVTGGRRADIIVRTNHRPFAEVEVTLLSRVANTVTVELGGDRRDVDVGANRPTSVTLVPRGVYARRS